MPPPSSPSSPACGDDIRRCLHRRVDACGLSPGMVVGLTQDGRHSVWAQGAADTAGRPMGPDTLFEIGSITKLFTAVLLADMARLGETELDEPVAALLPPGTRVPERDGTPITLLHLATHTSGLPRLPADLAVHSPDPYAGYTSERLYASLAECRLTRTPGEGVEYSNLGAGLLGHALGLRAGQGYEGLLASRVLGPLGMASTAIHLPPALAARLASAHDDSGDPVPAWEFGVLAGAGGLRSTAPDMLLFLDALLAGDAGPLGAAATLLMAPRDAGAPGLGGPGLGGLKMGGLGLGVAQPEGDLAIQHEGGTGGFRSYAGCVPAWRRGTVVLANASTGACADLGIHMCDPRWALQWHRRPVAVHPASLDRLTGCYRIRPGLLLDVTRRGDRLLVQVTGQAAFRVFPLSEWSYFYKAVGAQITFEPGPDGRAARLILHQNARDQTADRIG